MYVSYACLRRLSRNRWEWRNRCNVKAAAEELEKQDRVRDDSWTIFDDPLFRASRLAGRKPNFGPNVLVFTPSMSAAAMQQQIDKVYSIQRRNEFGPQRNALLFLPWQI